MIAFPADPARRALSGLLVAAVPLAAAAQPVPLRPPAPDGPPTEEAPAPAAAPEDGAAPAGGTPGAVAVDALGAVDPGALGLIDEAQGGFPLDVWRGADWGFVKSLLPRMPGRTTSATMRALSIRLLASRAAVPEGKPPEESFVGPRVDRLLAAADIAGALGLVAAVPERLRDESFSRIETETLFFDNRNADACARVKALAPRHASAYWRQAEVFCIALDGDLERAELIADLLRERDDESDPAYFAAVEALGGAEEVELAALPRPSGLLLAMTRAASLKLPRDVAEARSLAVLRWVARAPNADLDLRLLAAEKSVAAGALSAEDAAASHLGIPFAPDELRNPVARAEADWGPRARALLVRAAAAERSPQARAEILRRAWEIGRERGGYGAIARLSAPLVARTAPATALLWFAADAARVLLAAGRLAEAKAWLALAAEHAGEDEQAARAEADLWPLALVAGADDGAALDPARLARWRDALREAEPGAARRKALAFYSLLDAVGREVPAAAWRGLLDAPLSDGRIPSNPAWRRSLRDASADGRIGATVLLAAVGAAEADARGHPAAAAGAAAVAALRRVGLEDEARRLALESALAAGL